VFSDGMTLNVPAKSFRVKRTGETPDSLPTSTSCTPATSSSKSSLASSVTNSVTSSKASSSAAPSSVATTSAVVASSSTATSNAVASSSATSQSQASSSSVANANYGHTVIAADSVQFFANNAAWADIHFTVNGGGQQNIRMVHNADNSNTYELTGLPAGATVRYFMTIAQTLGAMDTPWAEFVVSGSVASSSAASSTPTSSSSSASSIAAFSQHIEAETYAFMSGLELFGTGDVGGGQMVGAIDAGDWMAFTNITFPTTGNYLVEYRVASPTGSLLSLDLNGGSIVLGNASIPATGDWGNFTTLTQTVTINAGTYNLGIYAQQGGWSINWLRITKL
jgi:hypothetical protein